MHVNAAEYDIMKILIISDYREINSSRSEADWMIRLAGRGHDVTIMTYPEAGDWIAGFSEAGLRVIPWHPRSKGALGEIRRIRKELVDGRYQILQLFNSQAMLNGIPAAIGLPVKVVLYRGYAGNIHWYDPTAYLKYLHPRVDGVICLTEDIMHLVNRQNWYRPALAARIPKGHDPDRYRNVEAADLRNVGIPPGSFTVVCMANNRPFKDIPTLLRAAIRFTAMEEVWLLLIGRDMDHPENLAILKDTPAADKVCFAGYLPDPLPYLKAARVIVNTSTGGEGLNKAVIEGMFLGLVPVITDISGNRDLVRSGQNGYLVPVGDPQAVAKSVMDLASEAERYALMREEALAFIESELSVEGSAASLEAFYLHLLGLPVADGRHSG